MRRLVFFAISVVCLTGCPTPNQRVDAGTSQVDAGAAIDVDGGLMDAGQSDAGTMVTDAGPPGTWDNSTWDNASYQ